MVKLKTEEKQIEDLSQGLAGRYKPTDDEIQDILKVLDRFKAMKDCSQRSEAEEDWDNGDKEYRAYVESLDDDDKRTNINKPISFAVIETEMQETIERRPRPTLKPREHSDIAGVEFANDVLKFSFDRGEFDYQYYLAKKEARIYGTGVLFEYYREDKRIVKELTLKKDKKTGEIIEEYKDVERIDFDDCYAEYIPLHQLYFDPAANHINKCRDMVRREIMHIDEFKRIYGKKRGFKNVEYVVFGGDTNVNSYYEPPRDVIEGEEVEVLHYFNRALDQYYVVANGVLTRQAPNPYPHKELPAVVLYCYKIPDKFYGLGVPKIIKSLVAERNTMSNLRIDYQKQGLQKMFLYDDMIELDELDLVARPFGGIPINTQGRPIDQVIRWIEYGDVKMSGYKEDELLTDEIRRTTGVDDRVQGLNVGGTATEAAILKESSMRRINMKETLAEIDSLIRLGKLRMANIAFFYPIPKIERIISPNNEQKTKENYKTIRIEEKSYTIDENGQLKVDKSEQFSLITLNKKFSRYLEGEYDVVFDAEASTPISKPLMQGKITEMFNLLTASPALIGVVDPRRAVRRYLRIFDEDPQEWLKKDVAAEEDMEILAEMENQVMTAGQPLPPTKGATEDHTKVHLSYTKSSQYEQADPTIQQIIEAHIRGEGAEMGIDVGETPAGAEVMAGGQAGMTTQLPKPEMPPTDIMPNAGGNL